MSGAPSILVCDHRGEGLSEHLRALATAGLELRVSTDLRGTLRLLAERRPDLVVLDPLAAGGRTELDELERWRATAGAVPLLLVARAEELSSALAATVLEQGLFDLIRREAPLEEYLMRIERLRVLSRRQVETDELRHRALHDDRTDLLRPQAFQQRLTEHFSAAQRHRLDLALVLIDLDHFGNVNKRFDHTVGDLVIARVGDVIRATLRAEDVAGRIGGDEFAALLPYTKRIEAAHVVRRLRDAIKALSGRLEAASQTIAISASLGFETFDGADLDSLATLRAHAELALRDAKRQGGDRGVYFRTIDRRPRA
jgi:diguanylate cyclase (GGDEF)-like protein